jgi:hypothetical protein
MSFAIQWDKAGEREVEMGTDRGVLYVVTDHDTDPDTEAIYGAAIPWNGLISVEEAPEGGEPTEIYADNIIYGVLISPEKLKLTLEHYSAPPEFYACDGLMVVGGALVTGQTRLGFGFTFRSRVGTDVNPDAGYKLHIVWGCKAGVASKGYKTLGDSQEAITFSHSISTLPVIMANGKSTAELIIPSRDVDPAGFKVLEDTLYGTAAYDGNPAIPGELPTPDEVLRIINVAYLTPSGTVEKAAGSVTPFTLKDYNDEAIPCTWSITGIHDEDTTISETGSLTIAADETAASISVVATPISPFVIPKTQVVTISSGD